MKKTNFLLIFVLFISSIVFSQDDVIYSTKDAKYIEIANNALITYLENYDELVYGDFSLELDIVDSTYRSRIIRYDYCYKKIPIFKKSITVILSNNGEIEYMNRKLTPLSKPIDYNDKISKMGIKSIVESYLNKTVESKYFKIDTRFELIEERYRLVSNIKTYVEGDFYNTYFKIKSNTGEILEVVDKNKNNRQGKEVNFSNRSQDSGSEEVTNMIQSPNDPNGEIVEEPAKFNNPDPEGTLTGGNVWCTEYGQNHFLGRFIFGSKGYEMRGDEKFHYYDLKSDGSVDLAYNVLYKSIYTSKFSYDYYKNSKERTKYLKLFAYYHTTNFVEDDEMQIGYVGNPKKLNVEADQVTAGPEVFISLGAINYTANYSDYNPLSSDLFIVVQAAARVILQDNDFGSFGDAMLMGYADYLAQSYRWAQPNGTAGSDDVHQCFDFGGQDAYLIRHTDYPYSYTEGNPGDFEKEQIWASLWMFMEEKLGRKKCQAILKEVLIAGKDKRKQPDVAKIINEIIDGKNDISNFTKCEILNSKITDIYGKSKYHFRNNNTGKIELANDYSSYSFHYIRDTKAGQVAYENGVPNENGEDVGNEPNEESMHFWISPDIWNCSNIECTREKHENPVYGGNNTLFVRIHNKGCGVTLEGKGEVKLYASLASTITDWPLGWGENEDYFIKDATGQEVLAGKYLGSISLQEIPEGESREYGLNWDPFNPADYVNMVDYGAGGNVEVCILARIVSDLDPMYDEGDRIEHNIKFNDNIALRNMSVVSSDNPYDGNIIILDVPDYEIDCSDTLGGTGNQNNHLYDLTVEFIPTLDIESEEKFAKNIHLSIKMSEAFKLVVLESIMNGGGTDAFNVADDLLTVTDIGEFELNGLNLDPKLHYPVKIIVDSDLEEGDTAMFQLVLKDWKGCYIGGEVYRVEGATGDGVIEKITGKKPGVQVYPVPSKDFVYLLKPGGKSINKMTIYSASGKLIKQLESNEEKVNIKELESGVYLIKVIYTNGEEQIVKFIKY